jgi:hypothetical protein
MLYAIQKTEPSFMEYIDYSEHTDFEINTLCAERRGLIPSIKALGGSGHAVCVEDPSYYKFDPCHDPAAAWPIIEYIFSQGVTYALNGGGLFTGNMGVAYGGKKYDIEDHPLRANMRLYLQMTDRVKDPLSPGNTVTLTEQMAEE